VEVGIPQKTIGDKQCTNCTQDNPIALDQEIPQAIGDEQSVCEPHIRHSNDIGPSTPQVIGDKQCAQDFPTVLDQGIP